MLLFVATTLALVTLAQCGNYTVTQEAWFDVEVQDMDGPGQDYRGRFVIALFGETAPMTSMNFASITKGYKKGKVRRYNTTCSFVKQTTKLLPLLSGKASLTSDIKAFHIEYNYIA